MNDSAHQGSAPRSAAGLFLPDGHWRDVLAFTGSSARSPGLQAGEG